ncbi:DUF6883 domain-containing protein [Oscillatoria sp. HE19RPO]|uniref:DUF6883 domain-containing protein n=1 Tax=Oscillatoria sp. HE19RPO TaxID=2954806 RepID=UPI0020C4D537|nr:DUF6883 domain-containing protein [Oscillatoria sp. HE19RPO]
MQLPNAQAAFIDLDKLRNYSLNSEHHRGKHKARLFASILGLTCDDAEELQYLLAEAAQNYDAVPTENDQYGQRYCIDFAVTRLGQTATIRSNWSVRISETFPRLTSCYIIKTKP